ncbi:PREDICTED: WD repeat-containing protein 53 isoform X1 [Nelumbo nucifera]|uniref:WD repeat-containing protein 53 isoform X1 n=1 Tax=Nelumbo nucifera TaxID=4432 RepID=A0A1U7ZFY1_NELNU|nr:PREDICTED: WD repeat-containing protein 53 isoform X1 [Nelumbo nucifera]XP_010246445.1 PREDICTED: WD repeat-containing protein 53 isoform X1 [Nelumbo nucifera]XP_010246446.1 PREDICTED: WD repeat-containing protein 53 isoform X1 [Nelumbo nucifera]
MTTEQTMKPRRLRGHKGTVTCCIASRDRPGVVATSGEDGCICWFDMRCKDVLFTMDLGKKPISAMCFKPGNEDVLYASSGAEVMCFDVHLASSWKPLESYNYNKDEINQIACSSKASFLAAADDCGDVKIIDIRQQCLYKTLRAAHTSICSSVQFLPWRPWEAMVFLLLLLLLAPQQQSWKQWFIRRKKKVTREADCPQQSNHPTPVITGGLDAKLVMWDFSKGRPHKIVDFGMPDVDVHGNESQCFNPAFVHAIAVPEVDMLEKSSKICVVARGDGVVDVIDIECELAAAAKSRSSSQQRKGSQPRSRNSVPTENAATNDQSRGKRFHLDYASGGHAAAVSCVAFSLFEERGRFIISGGNDALVKVWDWSKHLDAGQSSNNSDLLKLNINISKKVNWLCTTPTNSENLVVCDTSKVVKVYSIS